MSVLKPEEDLPKGALKFFKGTSTLEFFKATSTIEICTFEKSVQILDVGLYWDFKSLVH